MRGLMKNTMLAFAVVGSIGLAASIPVAHAESEGGTPGATPGRYWTSQEGTHWRTGFGACWGSHYAPKGYTAGCDPEPKAEAKPVEMAAVEPTYTTTKLNTVTLFAFNSAELRPEGVKAIDQLADRAKSAKRIDRILVSGYTDSTGPESYNMKLSERRADAVKEALAKSGINMDVIQARGYGESDPAASNATKEGRQQNRRVTVEALTLQ